ERMRQRLREESPWQRMMTAAHADYAAVRLRLIDPEVLQQVQTETPTQYRVLADSGVGGARVSDGVKCLHTHLADYLGRRGTAMRTSSVNPIGRHTAELLS